MIVQDCQNYKVRPKVWIISTKWVESILLHRLLQNQPHSMSDWSAVQRQNQGDMY